MISRKNWFALAAAVLVTFAVGGASASAQDKPNALTPKEIADGWILLFDGESTFGWKTDNASAWTIANGELQGNGDASARLTTTSEFGDFELKMEVASASKRPVRVLLGSGATETKTAAAWKTVTVRNAGKRVPIALALGGKTGDTARVRSVKLRPLGLKSVFNGKDKTGWKEIPGHASVYTVTPEGWLNVKNGNGDIQSEGQWGDFVLQLDIFSNGDHLNSGVFFRAAPGDFWSGYEAQIRNQWQGDDRTKPVDYGTGGIYNRQPARKVVSSDREWFTMTVLANGTHMATWVNGYQIADFTDTRPVNENNARAGTRTKAGVISLQGHDPTTDLSFRNIRIVELPK